MQADRWTGDLINLLPFFESRIKFVLFVDHCPAHPAIKLRNNNPVFLPPNMSMLQSLDQGVFRLMKHHFRFMLVNYLLKRLENRCNAMECE
jgi:hypothetical protein